MALKQVKTEAILEQRLLDLELNRDQQPERPTSKSNNALAATLLESGISSGFSVKREMTQIPSVVWYCPPKKAMKTRQLVTMGVESFSDNPLESMPSQAASAEYARQIAQQKLLRQQEEIKEKLTLEDLQHEIIAKNRAQKNAALRATKERVKEEIEAKNALKASLNAEKLRIAAEMEQKLAREIRAKEEAELLETLRIRDIQANKRDQQRREAEEYAMQLEVEKMLIARVSSEQEAQEIIRRNKEEDRMRYLEERRRVLEARKEQQAQEEMARREANKVKAMEAANEIQARLRRGNFVWHNGQLGFYDNVRREVKEYVQYEDSYGRPYFYDPVYGTYQYRLPEDADVHHHIEDERKEYDAVHGEGAYDAYKADIAFKDSVNQYGGYYDEHGRWIEANGYYDENYNWVAYEGYYNEQGKYIRFAKISGDLNFMV